MKLKIIGILGLVVSLSSMVNAKTHGDVFSPEQGIICDKKAGFCSDSYGISIAFTKEYLG